MQQYVSAASKCRTVSTLIWNTEKSLLIHHTSSFKPLNPPHFIFQTSQSTTLHPSNLSIHHTLSSKPLNPSHFILQTSQSTTLYPPSLSIHHTLSSKPLNPPHFILQTSQSTTMPQCQYDGQALLNIRLILPNSLTHHDFEKRITTKTKQANMHDVHACTYMNTLTVQVRMYKRTYVHAIIRGKLNNQWVK